MTELKGQHLSTIALGFLLLASTANSANAQIRIDKDQTGRIVAMANLSTASGCSKASGVGRVVDQHFEFGQMKGVTFKDSKYGESYLNLPLLATISPASARARVAEGFATLLVKGQDLKVVTLGCGAAGRIEKLASVELVGPPARAGAGSSAVRPSAAAAAASPDTGVRTEDADDSVLRAPDGPKAAATNQLPEQPSPTQAKEQAAPHVPDGEVVGWRANISARTAKVGIANEGEYTTIWVECTRGSGRATIHVDAPGRRLKRGSRQQFQIAAGQDSFTIRGTARYDEVDHAMAIEATAGLGDIGEILSAIERYGRFTIKTPGRNMPVDVGGAGAAIPKFIAACGRRG